MNAPDTFAHNAQSYRVGFLAAGIQPLLAKPVGTVLAVDDARQLQLVSDFLRDVLAGARLVSKGETGAVSATKAVRALGYALGPLAAIRDPAKGTEEDVVALLKDMLECSDSSTKSGQLSGPQETLSVMALLFAHLSKAILANLNQRGTIDDDKPSFAS